MKNLFKNLMLVAVAAMAFTACTETNEEVNAVSKTTRYEFTANIAEETRSGFAEKEEGAKAYKSEWHEGDQIKIFVDGYDPIVKNITVDGKFEFELENAPESFYMTVVSPADSWESQYSCTIPTEQTPLANSVDPKAHVLQSQVTYIQTGSESISMSPQNACYGKMTVNVSDFEISKVEVSFNGGKVYTLNATHVENNVFWFAVDSMIDVSTFTVTAYDAVGNAITKTVDVAAAGKELKFQWGHVSTFSVSGLAEYYDYTSARISDSWGAADKLISFTSAAGKEDFHVNFAGRSFDDGSIAAGNYSIKDGIYGSGIYLGDYWGEGECKSASTGNVSVTIVNGCYVMVFTDMKDYYGVTLAERITFKGLIEGMEIPDPRAKLAAPDVTATVSGKTITLTWNAVEGADGYEITMYNPVEEQRSEIVTGTQYVFVAENGATKYNFKITAYASESNTNYRTSDEEFFDATTEDTDPKMEISESALSFTADGGEKTFTVTLKNTDATIEYTKEGDWFSVDFSGDTFTVTASANESETDALEGSITVTAGDLSQTIAVTQSKKPAASTGGVDGKTLDTAYKFTGFKVGSDGGYPVLVFYGAEDGRVVAFEPSGSLESCTGQKKLTDGCWWPHYMFYYESYNESNYDAATKLDILLDSSYSWIEKTSGGFTLEYFYIVSNGEAIYYTYDGVFNC